jgi:hypothetical protein
MSKPSVAAFDFDGTADHARMRGPGGFVRWSPA